MVWKDPYQFSPSLNALDLPDLPNVPAKIELYIEELLVKLTSIKVLFSLAQKFKKDNRWEAIWLGTDPIDMPNQDFDHGFVKVELIGFRSGWSADSLDEAEDELFELGYILSHKVLCQPEHSL